MRGRTRVKVISDACKSLANVLKDHDLPRAVGLAEVSEELPYTLTLRPMQMAACINC